MKILLNVLISLFLLSCFGQNKFALINEKELKSDTAWVIIDSSTINKAENTFEFILAANLNRELYEIYRVKNRDHSVEFGYNFSYTDIKNNYACYTVNDLPTGARWDILFDKNTKAFYRTDVYDVKALGDNLIKESIDFIKGIALVRSQDVNSRGIYNIKLNKIWEPTEMYKNNTLIKK